MNLLILTYDLPYPPDRGARIRDYHFLKYLSHSHNIILLTIQDSPVRETDLIELREYCSRIEVVVIPRRSVLDHLRDFLNNLLNNRPLAAHNYYHQSVAERLQEIMGTNPIDILQIEHSFLAPYIADLPENRSFKTVLDFHNIGFQQYQRMISISKNLPERFVAKFKSILMSSWESRYARLFDHCLAASNQEADLLRGKDPRIQPAVIPNGVDTTICQPLTDHNPQDTLLLIGTIGYPPNEDSVIYFCQEILPLIEERVPDINLLVVGHAPSKRVLAFSSRANITITGSVPEVLPYYERSSILVAPLRAGGGTRLKILEAMAYGVPVVSTAIGCEGLDVQDGQELFIADAPADFANAVVQLLRDQALSQHLRQNALALVKHKYDWMVIVNQLEAIYQDIQL